MTAETAVNFEALEAQAAAIMGVFGRSGYERVAPSILQPANVYLDAIGEELRSRTYVFTDPDGEELCLRPDLTVPSCRLYLERVPKADKRASYCYNGPAFRFQPGGGDRRRPREFRQAGLESFHATDREKTEVEVLGLVVEAVRAAGLKGFKLRFGDLGLFNGLIAAIDLPSRWRDRLARSFWRPDAFLAELKAMCGGGLRIPKGVPEELVRAIDPADPVAAEDLVARHLEAGGMPIIGTRSLREITTHLVELAADARAEPLPASAAALIEAYIGITAPPRAAGARISDILSGSGVDLSDALEHYRRRLELMGQIGVELGKAEFSAEYGRGFEYYTGFVFEIELPDLGRGGHIAGGGRYDRLVSQVGGDHDVPAVGAAIHTERLLAAIEGLT
ncbi:MAG: ATP phosphoribosyltransferase regulatory subunit [Hyphomicrobiaceae bacterium]